MSTGAVVRSGWISLKGDEAIVGRVPVALGVAALAEVLLALTALQKLVAPVPATQALRSVGLPVPSGLVRVGAAVELVAGVGALATGRAVFAAGVALCYVGFAGFIALARHRPSPVASCGCLGDADTPPTLAHLLFNLAAAGVCGVATLSPSPGIVAALRHQPLAGVPLVGLVALGCCLCWILLSVAPRASKIGG